VIWRKELRPQEDKQTELLDAMVSPPALVNGKAFVGTAYGDVVCLSALTGKVLWKVSIKESVAFQPAVAGGRVYVSTESGSLYSLETGDVKDDGWLMWGANASHTGRAHSSNARK
jgi:outer membrane protein assembly factor BamB